MKKLTRNSRSFRGLILQSMVILLLSLVISLIAFYFISTQILVNQLDSSLSFVLDNDNLIKAPESFLIDNKVSVEIIDAELNLIEAKGFNLSNTEEYSLENILEMASNDVLTTEEFENVFFEIELIEDENGENNFALITTYYSPKDDNLDKVFITFFSLLIIGTLLIIIVMFYLSVNGLNKHIKNSLNLISKNIKKTPYNREKIDDSVTNIKETQEVIMNYNQMIDEMNDMKKHNDELTKTSNRLISNLSHDLKSPITSLKGYSEILLNEETPPQEAKKYITYINESANDLNNMINVLFDQIKFKDSDYHLNLEKQDINEFLRNICAQYYKIFETKGFNFDFDIEEQPSLINFDPVNLKRVFINLLENIHTHNPSGTFVMITSETLDNEYIVCFKDNGIGIPEKYHQKIFDPFFKVDQSRQTRTNGLGLYSSKQIIKKHGGQINFRSEEAYKTVFEVSLPKK